MLAPTLLSRLEASRSEAPARALAALVRALVAEGVPNGEVYRALCRLWTRFLTEPDMDAVNWLRGTSCAPFDRDSGLIRSHRRNTWLYGIEKLAP